MLGFDVPTFVFQIINFLILLAILARFFYRPVLDVMRKRQEAIDARLEDADRRAQAAEEERRRLAQQSQAAAHEAASLVEAARTDAARERERLLAQARADAAALIDEARRTAAGEEQAAMSRVSQRVSKAAIAIAGSLIREASGRAVHGELLQKLLSEGMSLDAGTVAEARKDFGDGAAPLRVLTAYPLDERQQEALRDRAGELLQRDPQSLGLQVEDAPDLIAGARIVAGAVVIDMSVKHLLEELAGQELGA